MIGLDLATIAMLALSALLLIAVAALLIDGDDQPPARRPVAGRVWLPQTQLPAALPPAGRMIARAHTAARPPWDDAGPVPA